MSVDSKYLPIELRISHLRAVADNWGKFLVMLRGHAVAYSLTEALCYKPEGRGFDS
jgi:hypothetical protein